MSLSLFISIVIIIYENGRTETLLLLSFFPVSALDGQTLLQLMQLGDHERSSERPFGRSVEQDPPKYRLRELDLQ